MNCFESEEIGPYRFNSLHPGKDRTSEGFSWHLAPVAIVTVVAILFTSKIVISETEKGNYLPGRLMVIGMLALPVLAMLVAIVGVFRRSKNERSQTVPPSDYPQDSLHYYASVSAQDQLLHRSEGWLWVDGDLLKYRGDRFDFDLRYQDFPDEVNLSKFSSRGSICFLRIKGLPTLKLRLVPFEEETAWRHKTDQNLLSKLEAWRRAVITSRPNAYPPIRRVEGKRPSKALIGAILGACLSFGLLGYVLVEMFGKYLPQKDPMVFVFAMAAYPLLLLVSVASQGKKPRLHNNAIDKLKVSGIPH